VVRRCGRESTEDASASHKLQSQYAAGWQRRLGVELVDMQKSRSVSWRQNGTYHTPRKNLLGSILLNFRYRGSNRMVQGKEAHSLWTFQSTPPKKGPSLLSMLLLSRCKWIALRVYLIRTFQSILEERRLMTMILEETATRTHPLCMHFECRKPR